MNTEPNIEDILRVNGAWEVKHNATPELRKQALEWAMKTTHLGGSGGMQPMQTVVIETAEKHLNYILKGAE